MLGLLLAPALLFVGRMTRAKGGQGDVRAPVERFVNEHRAVLAPAIAVGAAYLDGHAGERDRSWLTTTLERRIAPLIGSMSDALDAHAVGRALRLAIRADFRDGETVRVRGWLLSRTEARLFALGSLQDVE